MRGFEAEDYPAIRPFIDHGLEPTGLRGNEVVANSPFAQSSSTDKFHFNVESKVWHDKKIGRGGGVSEFLAAMHELVYRPALTRADRRRLARERGLPLEALAPWTNLGWDEARSCYTLLVSDEHGRACDIRRYDLSKSKKTRMRSTAGCSTGLFGVEYLKTAPTEDPVYVCEGEWDAIAMFWLLRRVKKKGVVIAAPGASVFKNDWTELFVGRDVRVLYDHDEAGRRGDSTVHTRLSSVAARLRFLDWPDDAPEGYDVRDAVVESLDSGTERKCWKQLQAGLRDDPRVPPKNIDAGSKNALDRLKREWIYANEIKRFVFVGDVEGERDAQAFYELDKESFSDRFAEQFRGGGQRAAAQQMLANGCLQVARPAYLPGQPSITTERVRGVVLPVVNLHIPTDISITRGDIRPYLEHLAYVVEDGLASRTVLDSFTYTVRHPERKTNWATVLGGVQGLGKDLLVWPVAQALGRSNYCTPTPDDLESGYTDWLKHTKLVIVDTLRFHGKRHLMERMKPWIASPPERLRINGKYAVPYDIANLVSFFFMSNRDDALALDEDDRRFFVYWSPANRKPASYYRQLWDWLRANVGAVAHYFKHEHELSASFDPLAPPPMTDAKRHMIRANESPLTQHLRQALDEGRSPLSRELVTVAEIQSHIATHGSFRDCTPHAIGRALKELGAEKLDTQLLLTSRDGRGRERELRPHAWAVRHATHYRALNRKALSAEYERQRAAGSYRRAALTVVGKRSTS